MVNIRIRLHTKTAVPDKLAKKRRCHLVRPYTCYRVVYCANTSHVSLKYESTWIVHYLTKVWFRLGISDNFNLFEETYSQSPKAPMYLWCMSSTSNKQEVTNRSDDNCWCWSKYCHEYLLNRSTRAKGQGNKGLKATQWQREVNLNGSRLSLKAYASCTKSKIQGGSNQRRSNFIGKKKNTIFNTWPWKCSLNSNAVDASTSFYSWPSRAGYAPVGSWWGIHHRWRWRNHIEKRQ